ncbi:MAG: T6SS immunity protein Tdi1 domain-containing protein [Archangium sp.]
MASKKKSVKKSKPVAKKPAAAKKLTKKPAVAKKGVTRKPAPKKKAAEPSYDFSKPHPKLGELTKKFPPGRYADGLIFFTSPGALDAPLSAWLMGRMEGRVSLGRTAFGEFIVFRDLRARALSNGDPQPELACDIAIVDIHTKQMKVPVHSVEEWARYLDDASWQRDFLRKELHDAVKGKLGAYGDDECYGFVPALALGGAEEPAYVQRQKWDVHQAILLQT